MDPARFTLEVERAPHDAGAWHGLALAFAAQGDYVAALGAARRAALENPRFLAAQLTLGRLCEQIGYAQDAIAAFEAASHLAPLNAAVLRRLADAYRRGGRVQDALVLADAAAVLDPQSALTYLCLGDALLANRVAPAARRMYGRALEIDPQLALAECGAGAVALNDADWSAARAAFERALILDPDCAEARYNLALLELRGGNYRAGFAGYPAIMRTVEQRPRYHYYYAGVPLWDGAELGDRRLVIAYEQGLGNQIMMARYFNQLPRFGRAITIEAPPAILSLLRRNFPALTIARFTNWQSSDAMDVHLPLMQLPAVLNVAEETQIAPNGPYLVADPLRIDAFRKRLQLEPDVRHVGIVWHGNRDNAREPWRAPPLEAWAPLAGVAGIRFHSLQFSATPDELSQLPLRPAPTHELIAELDDSAALACLMDLIITIDTSMVHLAGSLGRPTWMVSPFTSDYRWGIGSTDSPWYPTLRIFGQRDRADWKSVFSEIADRLSRF